MAPRFERVRLWVFEPELACRMAAARENQWYLPGQRIPESVEILTDLEGALRDADVVLGAMPSHVARQLYRRMTPWLAPSMLFVSATKGLETGTLLRISQVLEQVVGECFPPRVGVLSGPSFAAEVARGEPTALAIASRDADLTVRIQGAFSGPSLRLYRNADPVGVELGAALKNVIAIGAGICHGLGLGGNTVAALIARGLAEITRLAVAVGARPETLAGLSGLGDLVLTSTGELSRNRWLGIQIGRGRRLADILASMRMVAEGVNTTDAAVQLGRHYGVELPITEQMYAVLRLGRSPQEAIRELMERSLKGE